MSLISASSPSCWSQDYDHFNIRPKSLLLPVKICNTCRCMATSGKIEKIPIANLGSIPTLPTGKHSQRKYPSCICLASAKFNVSKATSLTCEHKRRCEFYDLYNVLVPYSVAWSWQKSVVKAKKALIEENQDCSDTLIILQHHPVYTLGTGSSEEFLNFDIKGSGYNVYRTERGGEVTYHGPGQLVMYPIMNLRYHKMDLHWYFRALEEVVIRVLSSTFSIEASRIEGLTGVWIGDYKLAAIGIRVSQWVAYHGLALNVTNDLTPFQHIVPCGIRDRQVGSIKELLRKYLQSNDSFIDDLKLLDTTHKSLLKEFCEVFQVELHLNPIPDGLLRLC